MIADQQSSVLAANRLAAAVEDEERGSPGVVRLDLGVVAADQKAFERWATRVTDADLVKAFNVYMRKAQPGEADSSTS